MLSDFSFYVLSQKIYTETVYAVWKDVLGKSSLPHSLPQSFRQNGRCHICRTMADADERRVLTHRRPYTEQGRIEFHGKVGNLFGITQGNLLCLAVFNNKRILRKQLFVTGR